MIVRLLYISMVVFLLSPNLTLAKDREYLVTDIVLKRGVILKDMPPYGPESFDSVDALDARFSSITDEELAELLKAMPNLRFLYLSHASISLSAPLPPLGKLEVLDLAGTSVEDEALAFLVDSKRLRELDLSYTKVTGKGLRHVQPDALVTLILTNSNLTRENLRHVASKQHLETLYITGCTLSGGYGLLSKLYRLEDLRARACAFTDAPNNALPKSLKFADLSGNQLTSFPLLESDAKLYVLRLAGNPITQLASCQNLRSLTVLDLSSTQIGYGTLSELARLSSLRTLDLAHCQNLTDISVLESLQHLDTLDLSYCHKLKDVSVLGRLPSLKHLTMTGMDAGHVPWSRLDGLVSLDVSYSGFDDRQFMLIPDSIVTLNLDNTKVTWRAFAKRPFRQASGMFQLSLRELDLSGLSKWNSLNAQILVLDRAILPPPVGTFYEQPYEGIRQFSARDTILSDEVGIPILLNGVTHFDITGCEEFTGEGLHTALSQHEEGGEYASVAYTSAREDFIRALLSTFPLFLDLRHIQKLDTATLGIESIGALDIRGVKLEGATDIALDVSVVLLSETQASTPLAQRLMNNNPFTIFSIWPDGTDPGAAARYSLRKARNFRLTGLVGYYNQLEHSSCTIGDILAPPRTLTHELMFNYPLQQVD